MALRIIIAAELAWMMFRFGMFPVETLWGMVAVVVIGHVIDRYIFREGKR